MARKHIVVCVECGRQFDAKWGGRYDPSSRRYTCARCVNRRLGDARQAKTGMRQSVGAMIAKIAFGVLYLILTFTYNDSSTAIASFILGFALLAWGVVPWILAKKAKQSEQENAALDVWAQKERARILAERALNEPKICPYCGATTKGSKCEYCDQPLPSTDKQP